MAGRSVPARAGAARGECESHGVPARDHGRVRFRHELARLAILDALGPRRAMPLHRARARSASRQPGPPRTPGAARMAHHAEGADDGAAVLHYALAAALSVASELGAHREAADLYRGGAAALGRARSEMPRRISSRIYALECGAAARFDRGLALLEEAVATWRRLGAREHEAVALARYANLLRPRGAQPSTRRRRSARRSRSRRR